MQFHLYCYHEPLEKVIVLRKAMDQWRNSPLLDAWKDQADIIIASRLNDLKDYCSKYDTN